MNLGARHGFFQYGFLYPFTRTLNAVATEEDLLPSYILCKTSVSDKVSISFKSAARDPTTEQKTEGMGAVGLNKLGCPRSRRWK